MQNAIVFSAKKHLKEASVDSLLIHSKIAWNLKAKIEKKNVCRIELTVLNSLRQMELNMVMKACRCVFYRK